MPERATTTCLGGGCNESPVAFKYFPTVEGYCLTHGNVLADFLSLIDARGSVSFDGARHRWENVLRLRARGIKPLTGEQWRFLWDNRRDLLNAGNAGVDAVVAQGIHPHHLESLRTNVGVA